MLGPVRNPYQSDLSVLTFRVGMDSATTLSRMNADRTPRFEPLSSRDVAAFVAAVDAGTIQGAAEAMHLTQSAATKRIQSLERRLDTTLLVRGRDGVRPTAAGSRLYPDAQRALEALSAAAGSIVERAESDVIRLAASRTAGGFVLPDLLAGFQHDHPACRPQVEVLNSPGVIDRIRAEEAAIGLTEGEDHTGDLEETVLLRDEIVIAVAVSHPWADLEAVDPAKLENENYVSREQGSGTRAIADSRLRRVGIRLEPALELSSLAGVKRALRDGGFTLISDLAVAVEQRAGNLAVLRIDQVDMTREIKALRLANASHGKPAADLWRWLRRRTLFAGPGSPF